jgi:hypothetical protein
MASAERARLPVTDGLSRQPHAQRLESARSTPASARKGARACAATPKSCAAASTAPANPDKARVHTDDEPLNPPESLQPPGLTRLPAQQVARPLIGNAEIEATPAAVQDRETGRENVDAPRAA